MKLSTLHLTVFLVLFFFGLALNGLAFDSSENTKERQEYNVFFRWAFGALSKFEKNWELMVIDKDTMLRTGDKIQMLIEFKKECFIYVIYISSQGDLKLLFPYDHNFLEKDLKINQKYYLPQKNSFFELDQNTGIEKIHLLASQKRLSKLEELIENYELAAQIDRGSYLELIVSEIGRLRRVHRNLKVFAEKPLKIVGGLRKPDGASPQDLFDIDSMTIDILAENFYSRTFTIDHR